MNGLGNLDIQGFSTKANNKIFSKSIILFLVLLIINKMPENLKNIVSMHSLNREAKQLVAVLGKLCC